MKDIPVSIKTEKPKPTISLSTLDDKKIKNYTVDDTVMVSGRGRIKSISEMYDHKGEYEVSIELSDIVCAPGKSKKKQYDKSFYEQAKKEADTKA